MIGRFSTILETWFLEGTLRYLNYSYFFVPLKITNQLLFFDTPLEIENVNIICKYKEYKIYKLNLNYVKNKKKYIYIKSLYEYIT